MVSFRDTLEKDSWRRYGDILKGVHILLSLPWEIEAYIQQLSISV